MRSSHRPSRAIRAPCATLFASALLAAVTNPVPVAAQSVGGAVAFRVHLDEGGQSVTTSAVRGPELGAFLDASGEPTMLEGAVVGGTPVTPMQIPVLAAAWADLQGTPPTRLDDAAIGGEDDLTTLDSLRFDLSDARQGPIIAGHATRHLQLHIRGWLSDVSEDGNGTPVLATGTADLWFASDLPFSWLPIAGHPGPSPKAVPLAFWLPEVAGPVVRGLAPRLQKLGLLLRADVYDSLVFRDSGNTSGEAPTQTLTRAVRVDSVGPAGNTPSSGHYAGLPRVSELRGRLAQAVLAVAGRPCMQMQARRGGSFELETSGPRSMLASGRALSLPGSGTLDSPHLVLEAGDGSGPLVECVVVVLPDGQVEVGNARVALGERPDASVAKALYLVMDPAHRVVDRVAAVENGSLDIERVGESVQGALSGTGWSLELDPHGKRQVLENLAFKIRFDAVPPRTQTPSDEPTRSGTE